MPNPRRVHLTAVIEAWLQHYRSAEDVIMVGKSASYDEIVAGFDMIRSSPGERDERARDLMAWRLGKEVVVPRLNHFMANGTTSEDVARESSGIKQVLDHLDRLHVELLKYYLEQQKRIALTPATKQLDAAITEYFLWSDCEDSDDR